ncbi:urease accessory protein [Arthrobacter sp. CAN_A214]|uniref:urease accessory protein UreD n=1 Tax=Arthrobacter sp. CAN_A214 TaxID=2787720 RepID=UPI0018C8D944
MKGSAPEARATLVSCELVGGRARISVLDQGQFLAPRPVHASGDPAHLKVALIGIAMMLLGGDEVALHVEVGAGVVLEVVEPAGMVAYDADGERSRWKLKAQVADGGTLIWDGAPMVASSGSNVLRETTVSLGLKARVLMRETLVLGRSGEVGGQVRSVSRFRGPEGDYLYEDLDLTGSGRAAVGILGNSRVMDGVTAVGWRPAVPSTGGTAHLVLARPGAVHRSLTADAHVADAQTAPVFTQWRSGLLRP